MAQINGTSGSDTLMGTNLADTLDGLADNDTLTELGAGGADVLVVSAAAAVYETPAIAVSLAGSVKADSLFGPVCSAVGCGAAR